MLKAFGTVTDEYPVKFTTIEYVVAFFKPVNPDTIAPELLL